MKKTFLLLATFAAVAVSCTKNEIVDTPNVPYDASVINFAPSTGLSKANDNGLTQLQVATGFEVFGVKSDGSMLFGAPTVAQENNYKYAANAWTWGSANDKQWPTVDAEYPLTFLAMFPAQDFTSNYPTITAWTKEITQGATTAATEDVLSAVTSQPAAPMVGQLSLLKFKHIMSNIKFSLKIPTGYTAYVTRVIYHNLHNVNTYDFLSQTWATKAVVAGTQKYEHSNAATQELVGAGAILPIATTADATIKAIPQNFATPWDVAAFKIAGAAWTAAGGLADWSLDADAIAALATGTYVELHYALVDANDVCVVGKIDGKQVLAADGTLQTHTGEDLFLRVGYVVDLTKKALEPAKRYTYQIALGTTDATGGTVLHPNYADEDGNDSGEDSDKEPGDDVNEKATEIGFTVSVDEWVNADGSFE